MSSEEKEPEPKRGFIGWVRKVIDIILAQYLVIGFAIACVLGYFFPCKCLLSDSSPSC
jgi:sodium/bile acid cotransporter 7